MNEESITQTNPEATVPPQEMSYQEPVKQETEQLPKEKKAGDSKNPFQTNDTRTSIFLKGILMGAADIVPGVSGGTMALITGIYARLIHAIKGIDHHAVKGVLLFLPRYLRGQKEEANKGIEQIDFELLLPLGFGALAAILSLAMVILFLMHEYTAMVFAFFFGLILASAHIVYRYIEKIDIKCGLSVVAGFVFVVLIIGLDTLTDNHSLPMLFVSGMVAICAMILPGISGSLILLILNQYDYMLEVLKSGSIVEIVVFMGGAIIGLTSFSRLLDYLLKEHHSLTMSFLFGLMLGALRKPVEEIGGAIGGWGGAGATLEFAGVVMAALVGFTAVLFVEKQATPLETKKEDV